MISVPLDLNNKISLNVFGDDLGSSTYDKTKWRLFRWGGSSYAELSSTNIDPGVAYWIIVKDANPSIDAENGVTVFTAGDFTMTIPSGLSQIGNPFNFNVSWESIRNATGAGNLEPRIQKYNGSGGFDTTNTLIPWEGYFIRNTSGGNITLRIPPDEYSGIPKSSNYLAKINPDEWTVQVIVRIGEMEDSGNYFGVSPDASDEFDMFDFSELPPIGNYVSLYFPHRDWSEQARDYTGDFRPSIEEGTVWDFNIETNIDNKIIELEFFNIESVPPDLTAILFDIERFKEILRTLSHRDEFYLFQGVYAYCNFFSVSSICCMQFFLYLDCFPYFLIVKFKVLDYCTCCMRPYL